MAAGMDDMARELMDLKTLVTKTLEKRGVLARIRAELRANVFAAIEEQEREEEANGSNTFSLIGTCNEKAKRLHASPTGKILAALVCEYLEWAELEHTLKVFLPECNVSNGLSRAELREKLGMKPDGGSGKDSEEPAPLLIKVLEDYLKPSAGRPSSTLLNSVAPSNPLGSSYEEQFRRLDIGYRGMRRE